MTTTKKTPKTTTKAVATKAVASKTTASKTTATKATTATPTTTRKTTQTKTKAPMVVSVRRQPSYQDIAERAYRLYQARGYAHGHHLQDWVQAEHEVYAELRQGR